jgi:hypothetical protein
MENKKAHVEIQHRPLQWVLFSICNLNSYYLLATRHSPLATRHSPLATRHYSTTTLACDTPSGV